MKVRLAVAIVAASLIASGCSKKQGSQESQATPRDAVGKFIDALLEFDKAKYMSLLTGDELELKAASTFMDYLIAVRDFKKAVIDAYGVSGWAHFENEGGAKLSLDMSDTREKLDSMQVRIEGEKATCTVPGEAQVMHLSRRNGMWYVDAGGAISTGGTSLAKFIKTWSEMADAVREKQRRIGQPGVTAPSLDKELGDEILKILMSNR